MIVHARLELVMRGDTPEAQEPHVCATCTRCGQAESVKREGRLSDNRRAALDKLQDFCRRGELNRYVRKVVPEGVRVWWHHVGDDKLYPLEVTCRTVHGAPGPVPKACRIVVAAEDQKAAELFALQLKKWGYGNVTFRKLETAAPTATEKRAGAKA